MTSSEFKAKADWQYPSNDQHFSDPLPGLSQDPQDWPDMFRGGRDNVYEDDVRGIPNPDSLEGYEQKSEPFQSMGSNTRRKNKKGDQDLFVPENFDDVDSFDANRSTRKSVKHEPKTESVSVSNKEGEGRRSTHHESHENRRHKEKSATETVPAIENEDGMRQRRVKPDQLEKTYPSRPKSNRKRFHSSQRMSGGKSKKSHRRRVNVA